MKTRTFLSLLAVIISIAAVFVLMLQPGHVARKLNTVITNFSESVNIGVLVEDADTGKIV
jgi:ABC-type antimicrobial peptide transport system permease subunit